MSKGHHGVGPVPSRIMLVGEAWGSEEERLGEPLVGTAGQELNRMLHEAGIMRSECYVTNVINYRPPNNRLEEWIYPKKRKTRPTDAHIAMRDKWVLPIVDKGYQALLAEITAVQPNVIVALGNAPMWALTGHWGVLKWRGSNLQTESGIKVIPTLHPSAVLRDWSMRQVVVNDLRRVRRHMASPELARPAWNFIVRPSFTQTVETLHALLARANASDIWLDLDLETRAGHIACCGISWSRTDALCIPFMCVEKSAGYWSLDEETEIVHLLYRLFTHPNAKIRWQNGLYDAQYIYRHWHFLPRGAQDTMISQHSLFSGLPKNLAFQASMYADYYVYWKDEGKNWDPAIGEEQLWGYNCLDCIYTREVGEVELETAEKMGLKEVHDRQQRLFWPVLKAMLRGVRIDLKMRQRLIEETTEQVADREALLAELLGWAINPRSSTQMQTLFYEVFQQPVIMSRAKKGLPPHPTCDDEALGKIAAREPLLRPIVNCIADIRTLGVFLQNFLLKPLDVDQRMRCSYNIGGSASGKSAPTTYRLSSNENAFGSGTNLQNIPSEKSKSIGKALARGNLAVLGNPLALPNLRAMFIPDPGYEFFDGDLDRADLQVVVWETDDAMLKAAMRMGCDIHLLNAFVIDGREPPPLEELVENHPSYPSHRGPYKHKREFAKVFCHATNYCGSARTIAGALGRTIHEIERAQKIWFGAHPGILAWHKRTEEQIRRFRFVENRFGYRWYIFDRIDNALAEAVAWVPQSTVSIVINQIWQNIHDRAPEVEVLLQVHDSLAGQWPLHRRVECRAAVQECARVVVPYDDPLVIPFGLKTSTVSWGECK